MVRSVHYKTPSEAEACSYEALSAYVNERLDAIKKTLGIVERRRMSAPEIHRRSKRSEKEMTQNGEVPGEREDLSAMVMENLDELECLAARVQLRKLEVDNHVNAEGDDDYFSAEGGDEEPSEGHTHEKSEEEGDWSSTNTTVEEAVTEEDKSERDHAVEDTVEEAVTEEDKSERDHDVEDKVAPREAATEEDESDREHNVGYEAASEDEADDEAATSEDSGDHSVTHAIESIAHEMMGGATKVTTVTRAKAYCTKAKAQRLLGMDPKPDIRKVTELGTPPPSESEDDDSSLAPSLQSLPIVSELYDK